MDYQELPILKELDIPYYVQIYNVVYDMICDGRLKEGDTLPGENILASYWNVSRSTVRMAVRKLEEDGFIYKMQGRKTTITGQLSRAQGGLQYISNPCISNCVEKITDQNISMAIQNGGKLIAGLLEMESDILNAVVVNMKYFVKEEHVATSITIISLLKLEEMGIIVDDKEAIEKLACATVYEKAHRSRATISAMEWSEEEADKPVCPIIVVMEDVLYEEENPISYHKYWMDSNWYRFPLDRKL